MWMMRLGSDLGNKVKVIGQGQSKGQSNTIRNTEEAV